MVDLIYTAIRERLLADDDWVRSCRDLFMLGAGTTAPYVEIEFAGGAPEDTFTDDSDSVDFTLKLKSKTPIATHIIAMIRTTQNRMDKAVLTGAGIAGADVRRTGEANPRVEEGVYVADIPYNVFASRSVLVPAEQAV